MYSYKGIEISDEMLLQISGVDKKRMMRKASALHPEINVPLYYRFFTEVYKGKLGDVVVDFGAGACWSGFVGRKLGFDVRCFDATQSCAPLASLFGITILNYETDGKLPFDRNSVDAIISRLVLGNRNGYHYNIHGVDTTDAVTYRDKYNALLVPEFCRVLKVGGVMYISTHGRCTRFLESVERVGVGRFFDKKKITVARW